MNKISLKHSIQQHLNGFSLKDDQLDELIQLQSLSSSLTVDAPESRKSKFLFNKLACIAATLIIAITAGFFISNQQIPIGNKVALEVSKNHLKLKPLEIHSNQLANLNNYFTQLDFKLVPTRIMSDPNWELLGARYCSIQGNTAAQLRLKNKQTGNIETLYQAPYYKKQFSHVPVLENGQLPLQEYAKGIGVNIWVEKGVLFALTDSDTKN